MPDGLTVSTDHPGGNGRVVAVEGDTLRLEQEVRDSTEWWFYWNVAVTSDRAREVTVAFEDGEVVGRWGPAVDRGDGWEWLGASSSPDRETFRYEFAAGETVRFAFSFPYQRGDLEAFLADRPGVERRTLARTDAGRSVPALALGDPDADRHVAFACRHHACESTASYVLEGLLSRVADGEALADRRVHAFPMVDVDGVERGDQGKARGPHDHNRDYATGNGVVADLDPIYPSTRAVTGAVESLPGDLDAVLDLHCPYKWGGHDDRAFLIRPPGEAGEAVADLSARLAATTGGVDYGEDHDLEAADLDWWQPRSPTFSNFGRSAGAPLSTTLEFPYFGTEGSVVTPASAREFGARVADALDRHLGDGN
ncbi:MAG: hypothetical protein ABEJ04_02860 [Halobacteriaceae archaeon]